MKRSYFLISLIALFFVSFTGTLSAIEIVNNRDNQKEINVLAYGSANKKCPNSIPYNFICNVCGYPESPGCLYLPEDTGDCYLGFCPTCGALGPWAS